MNPPARYERVRLLFFRLLGLVFLVAFLSLGVQVRTLFGKDGLLPAGEFLDAVSSRFGAERFHLIPTLFWIARGDAVLLAAAVAGAALSLPLVFGRAPRPLRAALWVLYLSFVSIGQDFLSFQWDNLLLEASFLAIFLGPTDWPPSRAGIFLCRWLLFRLLFESGVSKLALGDPTWRDGSAMVSYFETAPLPTPLGWWAHQLPAGLLKTSSFLALFGELVVPFAVFAPRRARLASLALLVPMQASFVLTSNYGFFNYLSLALHVFLLEDRDLEAIAARSRRLLRRKAPPVPAPAGEPPRRTLPVRIGFAALTAGIVTCSVADFSFVVSRRDPPAVARALHRFYGPYRSVNSYHLFAQMTRGRLEVVIEGTADGETWLPYEFRWKPGDPRKAPAFVAPHQPRVDFQLWFLLLGRPGHPYFDRLVERLCENPKAVSGLFARNPFPEASPREIRVSIYRYTMTDRARRRATGEWWNREFLGRHPHIHSCGSSVSPRYF